MTKIIVADDHDLVRMGIVRMLTDVPGFIVMAEASSGEEAVALARQHSPDVVLMDVKMPGIGGLEATKKILYACDKCKVIVVTSLNDEMFAQRLMKAGASGYVTKGAPFEEIVKAINTVVGGQRFMTSSVAQQMALKTIQSKGDESPFDVLSERELQTVIMLANNKNVGDIADSFCVNRKTVNTYRYRIFEKLHVNSDVELVLLAVKHKLLNIDSIPD